MTTKIITLITILAYSIIVSQSFMYILALKDVQLNLEANSYIEFRKLIDFYMRANFKYVIYTALLFNLLLFISTAKQPTSLQFILIVVAFLALIIDTLITVKGSLPINDIINQWSLNDYPKDWTVYRDKWLQVFRYRQITNSIGFISLLIGTLFNSK